MKNNIYLDYAGTTPIDPKVLAEITKHLKSTWGNASSVHSQGASAKELLENYRKKVAKVLGCKLEEVIFTGSGTESDNLAILGISRAYKKRGKHIVTSNIEHPAVLKACEYLEKNEGFEITYVQVGKDGVLRAQDVIDAVRPDTVLVSVIYANNEIGTIQPISEISKKLNKNSRPIFHSDACQAAGALSLNVHQLGVDALTLNGSKIYGPKGTGCLYLKRSIDLTPLAVGGSQEKGRRAGTENAALLAGFAAALEIADKNRQRESNRLIILRDYLIKNILSKFEGSVLNGNNVKRLPNNVNISFSNVDGETLMLALDRNGIQVSTGSACTSTSNEPSHVIRALNLSGNLSKSNLRISLGRQTTKKELDIFLAILEKEVKKMNSR